MGEMQKNTVKIENLELRLNSKMYRLLVKELQIDKDIKITIDSLSEIPVIVDEEIPDWEAQLRERVEEK